MEDIWRKSGIYQIRNLINGKVYIGKTGRTFNLRWNEHKCELSKDKCDKENRHLWNSWKKYGEENFVFEILCCCSEEELFVWENYYVELVSRDLRYNTREIDQGTNLGLKRNEEFCEAASKRNKGRKASEETRRRMSESHKGYEGKKHTQETKDKIGDKLRGSLINRDKSKEVIQINSDTGEEINVFYSINEAERVTGIHRQGIRRVSNGEQKTAGGFKWAFQKLQVSMRTKLVVPELS